DLAELFNKNLKPALTKAKEDLMRWESLPISLAGRVNSVKMVIMPRLLYYFNTVPTFIPKSFFKELDKHITFYITFSRRFYPKRLTYVRLTMYTHFTFTLMAHCTSGAIRG